MIYENKINSKIFSNLPYTATNSQFFKCNDELHLIGSDIHPEYHYVYRNQWVKLNDVDRHAKKIVDVKGQIYMITQTSIDLYDEKTDTFDSYDIKFPETQYLSSHLLNKIEAICYNDYIICLVPETNDGKYSLYKWSMGKIRPKWRLIQTYDNRITSNAKFIKHNEDVFIVETNAIYKINTSSTDNPLITMIDGLNIDPSNVSYYHNNIYIIGGNTSKKKLVTIKNFSEVIEEDNYFSFNIPANSPMYIIDDSIYCGISNDNSGCNLIAILYNNSKHVPLSYFPYSDKLNMQFGSTNIVYDSSIKLNRPITADRDGYVLNPKIYMNNIDNIIYGLSDYMYEASEVRAIAYCTSKIFVFCPHRYYYYDIYTSRWNRMEPEAFSVKFNDIPDSFTVADTKVYYFSNTRVNIINSLNLDLEIIELPERNEHAYVSRLDKENIGFISYNSNPAEGQSIVTYYSFNIVTKTFKKLSSFNNEEFKNLDNFSFSCIDDRYLLINKSNNEIYTYNNDGSLETEYLLSFPFVFKDCVISKYLNMLIFADRDTGYVWVLKDEFSFPYVAKIPTDNLTKISDITIDEDNRYMYILTADLNIYRSKIEIRWW